MKIILKYLHLLFWIAIVAGNSVFGQTPKNKGDKLYNKMAYTEAIVRYEKLLKKNPENIEILQNLTQCYRLTNQEILLEETYAKMKSLITVPATQPPPVIVASPPRNSTRRRLARVLVHRHRFHGRETFRLLELHPMREVLHRRRSACSFCSFSALFGRLDNRPAEGERWWSILWSCGFAPFSRSRSPRK